MRNGRMIRGLICATVAVAAGAVADELSLQQENYPRVFFFRGSEGMAANKRVTYERWEATFERLMGIMGKAVDEEVLGREARNPEFFTRFKKGHPQQAVLLHYNGNARDPRWHGDRFFAGHWIYYNGATVLHDVPAEEGETDIAVSDTRLFRVNMGRYRNANEDIGLCALDAQGKPNWFESEQVQLMSIDHERGTIRVRRGCYGTTPRAFSAKASYAAAHRTEGPWGKHNNIMWYYNYSTRCPKDAQGRTCTDVAVEHLGELFDDSGLLGAFDGLEFDVLHNHCGGKSGRRGSDCDADGEIDGGWFDGVNGYGVGVIEFCRKLRKRLGEDRIIMADGALGRDSEGSQRAYGLLNGIESEGWPNLRDSTIEDWSGGLNRHVFWSKNGRPPVLNYINHKFIEGTGEPGVHKQTRVGFNIHRLVFAAGVFTDSAITYCNAPARDDAGMMGIWDEFRMGTGNRLGWLGKPLAPPVRMTQGAPDLLAGRCAPFSADALPSFRCIGGTLALDSTALRAEGSSTDAKHYRIRLDDVPCSGPDLSVFVRLRAAPMQGCPPEMARLVRVGIAAPTGILVHEELPETRMAMRSRNPLRRVVASIGKTLKCGDGSVVNMKEVPADPETGAVLHFMPNVTIGAVTHAAYWVHPPWKNGSHGYTCWERALQIADQSILRFATGMSEKSEERGDGVDFRVELAEETPGNAPTYTTICSTHQQKHTWVDHEVSLAAWAGKRARLKFISDCGADNNTTADQSYWGDVAVLNPLSEEKARTKPRYFMTYANETSFPASFYFNDIRSSSVDLEVVVESSDPVWIDEMTAHAHPDAIYREFEYGLVIANPSPRPYTFDLASLLPGQSFRRLQATPRQDTKTNNGARVDATLTLEPQDALFLIRE